MNRIPLLSQILQEFKPISLEEIREAALMDRAEYKFLTDLPTLLELLPHAQHLYRLLLIDGEGLMGYQSTYQDTADFAFFMAHHLDRPVRSKVRYRRYEQTNSTFLELKQRSRKGETHKERVRIDGKENQTPHQFLKEHVGLELSQLHTKLEVRYQRITLVSENPPERLTFDLGLNFTSPQDGRAVSYSNVVVAELKTGQRYQSALFPQLVRQFNLRGGGFSKYGVGCCQLYPELPHNRFKPQILAARRIEHGSY